MMTRFVALWVVCLAGVWPALAQSSDAPEKAISLDFQYLSPPTILPADGGATATPADRYIRLAGKSTAPACSFSWPMRYPIDAPRYSVLILRYRATGLTRSADNADRVLQIQTRKDGTQQPAVPAIALGDLVQDGQLHEIRRDLYSALGETNIDALQFTFKPATTGGRLDLFQIRFERGPNAPAPLPIAQQTVDLIVTDPSGLAVPDATVRVGLLERANWSGMGTTNRFGRLTVITLVPPGLSDASLQSVEATVMRDGYLPYYIAPIELPLTKALPVQLTQATPPAQQAPSEPQPVAQTSSGIVYYTPAYDYYGTYPQYGAPFYYVYPNAPGWWIPPVPSRHRDGHRDHDGDRHRGGGNTGGNGSGHGDRDRTVIHLPDPPPQDTMHPYPIPGPGSTGSKTPGQGSRQPPVVLPPISANPPRTGTTPVPANPPVPADPKQGETRRVGDPTGPVIKPPILIQPPSRGQGSPTDPPVPSTPSAPSEPIFRGTLNPPPSPRIDRVPGPRVVDTPPIRTIVEPPRVAPSNPVVTAPGSVPQVAPANPVVAAPRSIPQVAPDSGNQPAPSK